MPRWLSSGDRALTGKAWDQDMTAVLPGLGLVPALAGKVASGWRVLDAHTIIGPASNFPGAPISIYRVDLRAPAQRIPAWVDEQGQPRPVDCFEIEAGGGQWLARGRDNRCYGTWTGRDGTGRFLVSADGELVCCATTDNVSVLCYRAGAALPAWSRATGTVLGLSISGRTVLVCAADQWQVLSLDDGEVVFSVPRVVDGRPAELAGEWLVWGSDHGLAIRRRDRTDGFVVATASDFWPTGFARSDGLIAIASSRTQSDAPGDLQLYEVDPVAGRVRAHGGPWREMPRREFGHVTPVPAPQPNPNPSPVPEEHAMINAFPALPRRAYHAAFHTHTAQYGGDGGVVGNTVLLTSAGEALRGELEVALARGQAVICATDPVAAELDEHGRPRYLGNILAWFIHADDRHEARAQTRWTRANLPEKPVIVYIDKPTNHADCWAEDASDFVDDHVWPCFNLYVEPHETPAAFEQRAWGFSRWIARMFGRPIVLVVQCYDRLLEQEGVDQGVAAFPVIHAIGSAAAKDEPEVIGFLYFSDFRTGGMRTHPVFRQLADALARATVARPNRFENWTPEGVSEDAQLRNLLGQDVPLVGLRPAQKARLLAGIKALTGATPTDPLGPTPAPAPPPDENPPDPSDWQNRLDVAQDVDAAWPELLAPVREAIAAAERDLEAARALPDGPERDRRIHHAEIAIHEAEEQRGPYVDQLAHELNRRDHTDRWGRKARREGDAGSLNSDALTYRLDDDDVGRKKLIDVLTGGQPRPTWDVRPEHEEPGNGFWHPPVRPDLGPVGDSL